MEAPAPSNFPLREEELELPAEPLPLYDITVLPDPPPSWRMFGMSSDELAGHRIIRTAEAVVLAKFHFWGIRFSQKRRPAGATIMKALWKLFYYMADQHRPQSWEDTFDFNRDCGPRLLKYTLDPCPNPASRLFPEVPHPGTSPDPGYSRPQDAPHAVPDVYIQQFLIPTYGLDPSSSNPLVHIAGPAGNETIDEHSRPTKKRKRAAQQTPGVASPAVTQPAIAQPAPVLAARGINMQAVIETVERAMMKLTYSDLERHPKAPSRAPRPSKTASSADDLRFMQVGSYPATATVKLSPVDLSFDAAGLDYPYRGRGPVWGGGSCAIDTTIVLGMLLDAGCTVVDRTREGLFTEVEKAFIEATSMNWDVVDDSMSRLLRDDFWLKLVDVCPSLKMGAPTPAWVVWAESTRNFSQFRFSYMEQVTDCQCQSANPPAQFNEGSCIMPPYEEEDQNGVTMTTLLTRTFYEQKVFPCSHCGSAVGGTRERRFNELPWRLVMTFDFRTRHVNHTENITFPYLDAQGQRQTATYRWLGGVYYRDNHTRVYWTDAERGEYDTGEVRMYDSQVCSGVIIGGLPPFHKKDRVPHEWVHERSIPLVVYERVVNPPAEILTTAAHGIYNMTNVAAQDKQVLMEHTPWARSAAAPSTDEEPWPRVLSNAGDLFYYWKGANTSSAAKQGGDASGQPVEFDDNSFAAVLASASTTVAPPLDPTSIVTASPRRVTEVSPPKPVAEGSPLDRVTEGPNLFDEMFNDPSFLADHPEMWPMGPPGDDGVLAWPELTQTPPKDPSDASSPFSRFINLPNSSSSSRSDVSMADADPAQATNILSVSSPLHAAPQPYRIYIIPSKQAKLGIKERAIGNRAKVGKNRRAKDKRQAVVRHQAQQRRNNSTR